MQLVGDPSYQKGLFPLRFFGKMGSILRERGHSYIVNIKDGNKKKELIVHPVHLKRMKKEGV